MWMKISLQDRAEAMLSEQQALDEKDLLLKAVRREGHSATRRIVTANIENRLQSVASHNAKAASDLHNQCTNISNQLLGMQTARHELQKVRKSAQQCLDPE